jgi:hypothetical protein
MSRSSPTASALPWSGSATAPALAGKVTQARADAFDLTAARWGQTGLCKARTRRPSISRETALRAYEKAPRVRCLVADRSRRRDSERCHHPAPARKANALRTRAGLMLPFAPHGQSLSGCREAGARAKRARRVRAGTSTRRKRLFTALSSAHAEQSAPSPPRSRPQPATSSSTPKGRRAAKARSGQLRDASDAAIARQQRETGRRDPCRGRSA